MEIYKSQQTNLCFLFAFMCFPIFNILFGNQLLTFQNLLMNLVQKGFMPIITALVNFGTIREVTSRYFQYITTKMKNVIYSH